VRNGFFDPPGPRILAHRGLALEHPENTLGAFIAAVSAGATHVETDVHASRDGQAVISHDPDLTRVAGRDGAVGDLTLAELQRIDLGDGEGFADLAEVLDGLPDVRFNIDVKDDRAVEPVVRAIRRTRAQDRVLVTSFSERRRLRTARMLPRAATSASVARVVPALAAAASGSGSAVRRLLRGIDAVQIPPRRAGLPLVGRRMLGAVHAAGLEVHVWTIDDPAEMARLLRVGVDGIVTDRSDLAAEVAARFRTA